MANEAVIIELLGEPKGHAIRHTVADGAGIAKGTLLKLTDPRTAVATSADNDPFGGIAAEEKTASDGITNLGAYTFGIFDIKASAGVTVGERVSVSGANTLTKVAAPDLLFSDVGIALETASTNEVIAVLVGSGF
jgi:hypothetical protein|tara:strand:+ start:458 stop:862 length:405 start_codon:yes stop_codon:yes gene_type:complete